MRSAARNTPDHGTGAGSGEAATEEPDIEEHPESPGERTVAFRPIRGASSATLLVTSFAVSYLLQNVALLAFGSQPQGVLFPPIVTQQWFLGKNDELVISKLGVITSVTALLLFVALAIDRTVA